MSAASGRHPRRYKQCQSISAGNTIALFRRALGEGQVPEILETIRQKRQEDRVTARLFREGKADEALARKERGGLLALLPGGYRDAIRAGVDEWERRLSANAGREGYRIGISVPTNADAHAVGEEIRTRQRARGELRGDDYRLQAVDQRGVQYEIMIAVGDTVRLFDRVNAAYAKGSRGDFGENGTTAEIVSIDPEQGVRLWRADGKVGAVRWTSLTDRATGRIRLAYGHVLTIDARQGATLTDHITLLPAGTRGSTASGSTRPTPATTRTACWWSATALRRRRSGTAA